LTRRPFPAVFDDGDRLEVKGASWTFNGSETSLPRRCTVLKTEDFFTKTGSGQTQEKLSKIGGVSAAGDKWRSHKLIKRLADSDAGAKHASFCAVM
jgi:hypothetical protein